MVTVRAATLDDLAFLADCNAAIAEESEGRSLSREVLERGVSAALQDSTRGQYSIAEYEGEPAGCLLVTREWSDWRNAYFWWIQSVYVIPLARGRAIYSALHREVLTAAARARDVCGVRLYVESENHHAQKVYRAVGMRPSNYVLFEQELNPAQCRQHGAESTAGGEAE